MSANARQHWASRTQLPPIIVWVRRNSATFLQTHIGEAPTFGTTEGADSVMTIPAEPTLWGIGGFTSEATTLARSKSNLRLTDREDLVNLVLAHYEQFDAKYRGLLTMKRVYVAEPLTDTEGGICRLNVQEIIQHDIQEVIRTWLNLRSLLISPRTSRPVSLYVL